MLDPAQRLRQAFLLHQQGRLEEADALYRDVLARDPGNAEALHLFGVLRAQRQEFPAAVDLISRSVALNPNNATAHYNLGNVLRDLSRLDEAVASYDRALALEPSKVEAWANRAGTLLDLNEPEKALTSCNCGLAIDPAHAAALINRANALRNLHRHDEALAAYDRVLMYYPDSADALNGRGSILQDQGRQQEAFVAYDKAFSLDTTIPYLEGWRLHAKMHICDWSNFDRDIARVLANVDEGRLAVTPYVLLAVDSSPARQLAAARVFAKDKFPPKAPLWRGERYHHEKIRVAYVSGEFREQATSYLTADLFETHDKGRFEIHGIATGHNDKSPMRKRIEAAFDVFLDAATLSDSALSGLIREREIDILVNLNGYFGVERTNVFACRPAPIQVNYLGYPGTMGSPYMDYIVADETIIPAGEENHYSERVIRLPGCYQPNDRRRSIGARSFTRAECGLPEGGFVFCCFNNNFKITPDMFDIWCRLLSGNKGSVLWLLEVNDAVRRNLINEAGRRGIRPDRIVFAPVLPLDQHLSRVRLADLFLDTVPHNAHTTASDALWCGVPVLTCLGSTFAGRVAASLLNAVGLAELITISREHYETLAHKIATDATRHAALKARLAENRTKAPLFDTTRYARSLEAAYRTMWERQQRSEAPVNFAVERSLGS